MRNGYRELVCRLPIGHQESNNLSVMSCTVELVASGRDAPGNYHLDCVTVSNQARSHISILGADRHMLTGVNSLTINPKLKM